ncbi:mycothiol conjugate amidase Mca [Sphaerisporangium sp. TRM90804]|uniref:mycothiol conjugate amidase Mca n=1 Tax=Sphaerisporangium sp. TRM90804 TaxID=3031113 RepID=UPI002449F63A|nr:mycothiol conjugate amidase Mca [Sphaerisporangium sp. TRM90804]MDH2428816.1 mycothiol conjugate amidase Mca [Sphaerisporangium sp. TRM90804]
MSAPLRLMAVHAHPDDESSKGAATMALYRSQGVDVLVCTCTGGERGSILNPKMERPDILENITEVRRLEMEKAREILDVDQQFMGFVDSGLPEDENEALPDGCFALQPVEVAAAPLVAAVRAFKPHVILTYDDDGGYPHPDHIMTNKVSVEAFEAAGDPDRYIGLGEPWQPLKLYYHMGFTRERFEALHQAMTERGIGSPYGDWIARWEDRPQKWEVTTRVRCGEYFETRDLALMAHATQVDPDGFFFVCPRELQQEVWPTEDYHLARSLVDTELPEDDLFAGIHAGEITRATA